MQESSRLRTQVSHDANRNNTTNNNTYAAFSPQPISRSSLASKRRATIIVHRKSPLLVATPPPVTRALAYSHPFLLPLTRLLGLLTWTSGNPWESFLLLAFYWSLVLHGDAVILYAGPLMVVGLLTLGLYSRRYSPLSSTGVTGEKHQKKKNHGNHDDKDDSSSAQLKSLDEIVDNLREFTSKCHILLDPLLEMTDFLSTQQTPTSATTKPAMLTLLIRVSVVTPFWMALTLSPFRLINTQKVILLVGTIILTWHSKPARITRVILWRSLTLRRICSIITGLDFPTLDEDDKRVIARQPTNATINIAQSRYPMSPGVRFTFILYENQRRWLGIGWTNALFSYERTPWTDEHLNPAPSVDEFELPEMMDERWKWRWVPDSEWKVDIPVAKKKKGGPTYEVDRDEEGWVYFDNKWRDGRPGEDGWSRYTRRRKWVRDAELVEIVSDDSTSTTSTSKRSNSGFGSHSGSGSGSGSEKASEGTNKTHPRSRWFGSSSPRLSPSPVRGAFEVITSPPAKSSPLGPSSEPRPTMARQNSQNSVASPASRSLSVPSSRNGSFAGSFSRHRSTDRIRGMGPAEAGGQSPSRSLREEELALEQDMPDQWSLTAGNGTRGVVHQSTWGLGDDAEMGLS